MSDLFKGLSEWDSILLESCLEQTCHFAWGYTRVLWYYEVGIELSADVEKFTVAKGGLRFESVSKEKAEDLDDLQPLMLLVINGEALFDDIVKTLVRCSRCFSQGGVICILNLTERAEMALESLGFPDSTPPAMGDWRTFIRRAESIAFERVEE